MGQRAAGGIKRCAQLLVLRRISNGAAKNLGYGGYPVTGA
jgi:hypothetical protein